MVLHQQPASYDFLSALTNLQDKIQQLSSTKQQSATPATRLGASWAFVKQNRASVLLLATMYSISTASVVGAIMSEHRLQGEQLLANKEHQQLQQEIDSLGHQVQQQQQLLDGLRADLQQQQQPHSSSWWWWQSEDEAVRQRMLDRLHQSGPAVDSDHRGSQPKARRRSASSSRGSDGSSQQEEEFGVRVGHLGRGFII